ncbi:MAG TPA: 7-cyano-7-deazaguanine synthase QueC [Candidatus Latescibacteria bacterium]|jgi:7-cyano-7-deazaguanine synthase|nr:7-cyano-7-deazaguanine synthase QueC [Candidatus Latescibacterota bacterium]HJP34046.1 7-cyano-7-deazaguanine synthase QueC [Candidatus Latescibacterota bacterium]
MMPDPPENPDCGDAEIRAVALLSGGLDSCVTLALAIARHGPQVGVLHAGYGQRTALREARAANAIADHYGLASRRDIDLTWLRDMGGSSLTDTSLPVPAAADTDPVPSTYVPFRNAILLSAAVAWAEVLGATEIFCGAHAADSAYPDTQPAFFAAFDELARQGTAAATRIEVRTPLLDLDKGGIVRRGLDLNAPLHLTWSCYAGQDRPCRRCHSCDLRARGFAAAGHVDPIMRD